MRFFALRSKSPNFEYWGPIKPHANLAKTVQKTAIPKRICQNKNASDAELAKDNTVTIAVQINGKMRGTIEVERDSDKEKVIAAQRSGITKILLPKDNEKDVSDIPEEVRNALTIIHVSTIEEVLKEALEIELPECKPVLNRPKGDSNVQLSMVGE